VTKRKLDRFAEMKTFPNVIEPGFHEVFEKNYKLRGKWKSEFFGNDKPIVLELGCGKGEYTVALACKYPDRNFIGIDIKGARIWKGAKTAVEENIPNAAFLRTRIDFITSFFAENEVEEIWVTFPDPQPKKSRKRLISPMFLSRYQKFIEENGIVNLKTDNTELFDYAEDVVKTNKLRIITSCRDVHGSRNGELEVLKSIKTFYEKQFIEQNKKIKYLSFELDKSKNLAEPDE